MNNRFSLKLRGKPIPENQEEKIYLKSQANLEVMVVLPPS
ncbi:DUF1997 domain-containing protein [cyanobacterium endosymbiont of Rhopalodia gibberula]|nr:DUF1997 domain-containing protein [cyanobacterium endosymbiont of Rhopalodia gibberula]